MKIQGRSLVSKINGKTITKLEDVIEAFAQGTKPQHLIEFLPNNSIECLSKSEAEGANREILKTYGVSKDRRL